MWPKTFQNRLVSWTNLRHEASTSDLITAITLINDWWFHAPWTSYHLHWDDRAQWPDPWELLSDNVYCEVAKALGIMYTITMVDRADLQDAVLTETDGTTVVLTDKYILNWDPVPVVNTTRGKINSKCRILQSQVKQQIR